MTWIRKIGSDYFPALFVPEENPRWSPWLLAALSALLAAFLLPRQTPFPYQYRTGQPWSYRSLRAPFDYEVLHPQDQVKDQIERVNAEHGPYFLRNNEVLRRQKKRFAELVEEQAHISRHDPQFEDLVANPGSYIAFGQGLLDKIYSVGIVGPESEGFAKDDPNLAVFVTDGKDERRVPLSRLFTLSKARGILSDSLPFSPLRQPEMLLPIIEKVLAPNLAYSDSLTKTAKRQKLAAVLSTGLIVRKGDLIVAHDEIVTPEIAQQLDSLALRYEQPAGWPLLLGYGLMAFLAFSAFFFWLQGTEPGIWDKKEVLLLMPASALSAMLFVNVTQQFATVLPLLLPLAALPMVLHRWATLKTGIGVWLLAIVLTAFALDWGMAWLTIQATGLVTLLSLQKARQWQGWVLTGFAIGVAGSLAWFAACLTGRLPVSLRTADVLLFLFLSAFLTVAASFFGKKQT